MSLTQREAQRGHVLTLLAGGKVTTAQAAEALGITRRQVRRLGARLRAGGLAALAHGNRGRRAGRAVSDALRGQILTLARGKYAGFNDVHLTEKLTAVEGLPVSRATVRRVLRAAGLRSPRRRRSPRHRSRRLRRPQAGLLAQFDGSPYAWFEDRGPACTLQGAVDDATGSVLAACFRAEEDAAGYLGCLRAIAGTWGLPAAAYTDRHSIFVRPDDHWTVAEQLAGRQEPTQVGRAFQALGIEHIVAHSPEAKGRIERLWGTFQDRLVAELRLAGINTLAAGDAFLRDTFLPAFNARFAVPPALAATGYRPVPRGLDLDRVCAFHYDRIVAADNTVTVFGAVLQLQPGPHRRGYAKAPADVVHCLDGSWRVYVHDRLVATTPAPADPGQLRAGKRHRRPPSGARGRTFSQNS
jgi:transposase